MPATAQESTAAPAAAAHGETTAQRRTAAWEALGTSVAIQVTDSDAIDLARALVERELDAIDQACSRFRSDSDLERVNAAAGVAVPVGELLLEAVEVALRAVVLTDGDVDPTLGRALVTAGYDRDYRLLDQPPALSADERREIVVHDIRAAGKGIHAAGDDFHAAGKEVRAADANTVAASRRRTLLRARRVAGWRTVVVNRERSTIRIGSGVRLDLGATAKALAADRAAAAAHRETGSGVLVNLGGDIAVAGAAPDGGWPVFVTDDHRSSLDAPGQLITIACGGLATSSTTTRRWLQSGRAMHHLIDPATQAPARSSWRTVSVAAASCVDANIASTAAIVRGHPAVGWLTENALPARLVAHDGSVRTVGGWPIDGEAPVQIGRT
jgi:FAD:protein FMN transferase